MFGLFASRRDKLVKAVTDRTRPSIAIIQSSHGIGPAFWRDKYVLGFFYITIALTLKLSAKNTLRHEEIAHIISDVFTALSNINGDELLRRATALASEIPVDALFSAGMDDGSAVLLYTHGILKDEQSNPLFLRAQPLAAALARQPEYSAMADKRGVVASAMFLKSIVEYVKSHEL